MIIEFSDFVKVYKGMCFTNDLQRNSRIKDWLQADPGRDTGFVKCMQCVYAFVRQCCAGFPFQAPFVVQPGQRGCKGVGWREQVNITECPCSAFREDANTVVSCVQYLYGFASKFAFYINMLIRITGKAQEYLTALIGKPAFFCLPPQFGQEISTGFWLCKVLALAARGAGRVAVGTAVVASTVDIACERCIFLCPSFRFVDQHIVPFIL